MAQRDGKMYGTIIMRCKSLPTRERVDTCMLNFALTGDQKTEVNNFHGLATIHYHVQTLHQLTGLGPGQLMAIPSPGVLPLTMPLFSLPPGADAQSQLRNPSILGFVTHFVNSSMYSFHCKFSSTCAAVVRAL